MLSIKADFDAAERMLSDLGRRQLPFATALALNDTAESVERVEELDIARTFDRPTPFTKRALYRKRASKNRLEAEVGVKKVQAAYLMRQVKGGTRHPARKALVLPVQARRNSYGNLAKGGVKRMVQRKKVFVAGRGRSKTGHMAAGIYERGSKRDGGVKLLVSFKTKAQYESKWNFHDLAMRRARSVFERNFVRRLKQAIATAK